ncbi:MAG: prepilin-type N-terminal cleavage/methylation domain-containing protein [Lachnospiraceae bacterium]|nr:prepilin-type N-terminal cleavage/methylation domain-containing protein [Lachnospiraceae bacterium]
MLRNKRDRVKLNNRGFSLVELIVGIAILVIVSGAALGFMMTSTKTYKNVSDDVDLQEEAQIVMNQLETMVQNAGKGVNFMYKGKTITENPADSVDVEGFSFSASDIDTSAVDVDYKILYVYNQENRYVITFDVKNNKLMYREEARLKDESGTKFVNSFEDKSGSDALMCEYLEDFDVTLTSNDSKVVLNISLTMEKGVKAHKTNQNFFLRNSILLNTNVASIYPDTPEIETTYTRMVVKMGGKAYYSNTDNTYDVVITDADHSVPFYVTIEGNGYPSQEYIAELTGTGVDSNKECVKDNNTLYVSKDSESKVCYLTCTSKVEPTLQVKIAINIRVIKKCYVEKIPGTFDENLFYCGNKVELQKEDSVVAYVDGLKGQTQFKGTPIKYTWHATYERDGKTQECEITGGNFLNLPFLYDQDIKIWATAEIGNLKIESGNSVTVRIGSYNLVIYQKDSEGNQVREMYYIPYVQNWWYKKLDGTNYYYWVIYHYGGQWDPNYNEPWDSPNRLLPWYELRVCKSEEDTWSDKVWRKYTKVDTGSKYDVWSDDWGWNGSH